MQFISSPEDMAWLAEVFKISGEWGSAIITGNEDAPDSIGLFYSAEPEFTQEPDSTLSPENWPWLN